MKSRPWLPILMVLLAVSCMVPPKKREKTDAAAGDVPTTAGDVAPGDSATPGDAAPGDSATPGDAVLPADNAVPHDNRVGDDGVEPCQPSCDGMECGGDSCGGSCGTCGDGTKCLYGKCVTPSDQCLDPRADDPNDGCENGNVADFQINATNAGDQLDPVLLGWDHGDFVVAWTDCPKGADPDGDGTRDYPSCNVSIRAFDEKGAPRMTEDFPAPAKPAASQYRPGIGPFNGGFVLAWVGKEADGTRPRARVFMFDPYDWGQYNPYPEKADLTPGTMDVAPDSPVAVVSGDDAQDFLVAWEGTVGEDVSGIVGRRYTSPDWGQFVPDEELLPIAVGAGDQAAPSLVYMDNYTFAALWEATLPEGSDPKGDGEDCLGMVMRFDGGDVSGFHSSWTSMFQLAVKISGSQRMPAGVTVDFGQMLVATFAGPSEAGIQVRGIPLLEGDAFPEKTVYQNDQYELSVPRVAALPGGKFVVVWRAMDVPEDQAGGIYFHVLNAGLTPQLPEPIHVNGYHFDWQSAPQVAHVGGGEFIVVWESCMGQDGDGCGIFARRFNANGAVLPLVKP